MIDCTSYAVIPWQMIGFSGQKWLINDILPEILIPKIWSPSSWDFKNGKKAGILGFIP